MKIKNIVIVVFVFISTCINAQTFFKPGYVIKSVGDTLFGEVDYRGGARMSRICTYRHTAKDSVRHFSPDEILGYRFPESKYYISKEVDGNKVFLEFLINGRVNVYYLKDERGEDHYYIEKDSLGFAEIPYKEGSKMKEGQEYLYTSTRHIGLLNYYMQDAKGLQTEIMNVKKPSHENLINLAKDYHYAVCDGDKCIIYAKKLPPFKVGLEVSGGMSFVKDEFFGNYNFAQAGIIAHIWMPMVNENLFLKTGILFAPVGSPEQNDFGTEFTFQVEYVYPHGIIRPKFAIGSNLPFLTLDLTPGVNVKLTKWLFWTTNFNIGLLPYSPSDSNGVLKISLYNTSLSTGLYLNL